MNNNDDYGLILSNYLQEYGIEADIVPVDFEEDEKYVKVPENIAGRLDEFLQPLPGLVSNAVLADGTYKVYFDKGLGALQKSKQHPGFYLGNVVNPETNNGIRDVALLQRASNLPNVVNGVFSLASLATGQYFMAQINSSLGDMEEAISGIQGFMEDSKRSELQAAEEFLNHIKNNYSAIMEYDNQRVSEIANVQQIKKDAMGWIIFYRGQADKLRKGTNKKDKHEAVVKKTKEVAKHLSEYWYALYLYCYATTIEIALTQNSNASYLDNVSNEISEKARQYSEDADYWRDFFSEYIDNAKAYKTDKKVKYAAKAMGFLVAAVSPVAKEAIGVAANDIVDIADEKMQRKLDQKRMAVKDEFAFDVYQNSNMDPVIMAIESIKQQKMLYNEPIEFVKKDNVLYMKPYEDEELMDA